MFFHFDLMGLDRSEEDFASYRKDGWKLTEFKRIFSSWDQAFAEKGWGSVFLDNHDFPRAVSRWGNDSEAHWYHSATMLQTFLLTMRGTPYFYQGGEIGMTNVNFDNIEDYRDVNTLNKYQYAKAKGLDLDEFIENEKPVARDNVRTPMQWDKSAHAGFTKSDPWIRVNQNYLKGINVADQESDQGSVLHYFRRMVSLRKNNPVLIHGTYELLLEDHEEVYAYTRSLGEECCLTLLNFSDQQVRIRLAGPIYTTAELLISNDPKNSDVFKSEQSFNMQPYQCLVYRIVE